MSQTGAPEKKPAFHLEFWLFHSQGNGEKGQAAVLDPDPRAFHGLPWIWWVCFWIWKLFSGSGRYLMDLGNFFMDLGNFLMDLGSFLMDLEGVLWIPKHFIPPGNWDCSRCFHWDPNPWIDYPGRTLLLLLLPQIHLSRAESEINPTAPFGTAHPSPSHFPLSLIAAFSMITPGAGNSCSPGRS